MTQTISQPDVTISILGASTKAQNVDQKILFVGQKLSDGSATALALQEDIEETDINDLFGSHSMLAGMLREAKEINKVTQMDAIALDDNISGNYATASIVISGPATEDGTLDVYIGSKEDHHYEIAVSDEDTADEIGEAIEAAINDDDNAVFGASNSSGTITLTAKHKGETGNDIGLKVSGTVAGISYTITAFTGGSVNPTLTTVFDAIENVRYQSIVWPGKYATTELEALLTARFPANNIVLDGVGILSKTDTHANLKTALEALNNKNVIIHCNKLINNTYYKGSAVFELNEIIASRFAAIRALRLSTDEPISEYCPASINGAADAFGGDAIRSLPYFNTVLSNTALIESGLGFTFTEIEELTTAGGFVVGNNIAGNTLIIGEVPTTYKTDTAGNSDVSFKFLNYVDTVSGIREYMFNNYKSRYAQSRLTSGELLKGRSMANENSIRAAFAGWYSDLAKPEYVLTVAGEAALKYFKDNLDVVLDLTLGKVTVNMKVPIIVQNRTLVATIQMSFSTSN